MVLTVVCVSLDLLIPFRRKYAVFILPLEVLMVLVYQFTPRSSEVTAEFFMFQSALLTYFLVSCKPLMDAIILISAFLITHLIIIPRLYYDKQLTIFSICFKICLSMAMLALFSIYAMIATYISQIHHKMNMLMAENLNLLDQMNEGLIVISKQSRII